MISAAGAASIDGGMVQVLAQSGTYSRQTRYTILTASGGVDGQFTNVTSNLAFLTPLLSYDPNNVFLTLIRNDITFASVAQTPNQRAVAAALDSSPPLKPLVQAVATVTPCGAASAFRCLSGRGDRKRADDHDRRQPLHPAGGAGAPAPGVLCGCGRRFRRAWLGRSDFSLCRSRRGQRLGLSRRPSAR